MLKMIFRLQLVFVLTMLIALSGCASTPSAKEQEAAFQSAAPLHQHFQQVSGDRVHPARYFSCGEVNHPCKRCSAVNQHFSGEK